MGNIELNKLTVLLGAGASHDCGARRPEQSDKCHPPLAKDIFASAYDDILLWYPPLMARVDEVRTRLGKDESIEDILRDHIKQAEAFLSTCTDFLIIGFSGHDDHIVRLLEIIPNRSRITVVGKGIGNARQSFDTMRSRAPILNDK